MRSGGVPINSSDRRLRAASRPVALCTAVLAAVGLPGPVSAAEISCQQLPAASKEQCDEVNRLLKEKLAELARSRQQVEEAEHQLDGRRAAIIEQCRRAPASGEQASAEQLAQCASRERALQARVQQADGEITTAREAQRKAEAERDRSQAQAQQAERDTATAREAQHKAEAERDQLKAERRPPPAAATSGWTPPTAIEDCPTCPPVALIEKGAPIKLGAEHGRQQPSATALSPETALPAADFYMHVREVSVGEFTA
jgi:hypothetical protein